MNAENPVVREKLTKARAGGGKGDYTCDHTSLSRNWKAEVETK